MFTHVLGGRFDKWHLYRQRNNEIGHPQPNFANCSVIKIRIFYIPDCGIFFRGIPDFVISQMGWERFREVQTLVFAGFAALLLCRPASNSPGRTQLLLLHLEFLFSTRRNDFDRFMNQEAVDLGAPSDPYIPVSFWSHQDHS